MKNLLKKEDIIKSKKIGHNLREDRPIKLVIQNIKPQKEKKKDRNNNKKGNRKVTNKFISLDQEQMVYEYRRRSSVFFRSEGNAD